MKKQEVDALLGKYAPKEEHRANAKQLAEELTRTREALDIALSLDGRHDPLTIRPRERGAEKEGTAVLLLSDIHPEEVITRESVNGLNEFGPAVAKKRIERLVIGVRWMLEMLRRDKQRAGYRIRDFMLCLLGDLISNTIHPDLAENVALGPAEATLFAYDLICTVIDALLEDPLLESIVVPCNSGNHDRLTPKIRHQTRYETSLSTIVYCMLAKQYAGEKRVRFDISRGNMCYVGVYGKEIRTTHGDDISFGGGVGGITIPVRKKISQWNRARRAIYTFMGHFHTTMDTRESLHNGSVIGYSAFSQAIGADYEPPAQVFCVIDKQRGKRLATPIQLEPSATGEWA